MDLIWLSALTLLLHLIMNRVLGHLQGSARLLQWPLIYAAALLVHLLLSAAPVVWLLRWQRLATGIELSGLDAWLTVSAALAAAIYVRVALHRR